MFETPRYQEEQFKAMVSEELPGVQFDILRSDNMSLTVLRLRRLIEEQSFGVSDDVQLGRGGAEVLAHTTREAIRSIRLKAMADYGLDKAFEAAKQEAATEARREQRRVWLSWIDRQRPTEEVEGPDGEMIKIKRPLSYEMGRFKELLERS